MKKYILYKEEIEGFGDVKETVKVVEKKAASHIHFLKNKVNSLKEYKLTCEDFLKKISLYYWDSSHRLLKAGSGKKVLLVITGDKGIVGGLYHNIVEEVIKIKNSYDQILVLGEKGKKYLRLESIDTKELDWKFEDLPDASMIDQFSEYLFNMYINENLSKLDLVYPQFMSLASQLPITKPFLPFNLQEVELTSPDILKPGLPIIEGGKKKIFNDILRSYINIFFTETFMEAKLSEFSARTVAAEHASTKTEELISKINLQFLKERRRTITQSQLESFAVHHNI